MNYAPYSLMNDSDNDLSLSGVHASCHTTSSLDLWTVVVIYLMQLFQEVGFCMSVGVVDLTTVWNEVTGIKRTLFETATIPCTVVFLSFKKVSVFCLIKVKHTVLTDSSCVFSTTTFYLMTKIFKSTLQLHI